ncbi:MAG: hypothetical protein ACU84Q_11330 [Gammaproteobacteria bacterium]
MSQRHSNIFPGASLLLVLACISCRSTTIVDEYSAAKDSYVEGDAVVVLGRRHEMDKDTENDFISCVGEKITKTAPELSVIPEQEFVDALYPWFEASTAPMDISGLDQLLDNQVVAKKLDDMNVRYFIWINGFTETTDSSGSMSCAVGPGGGGCFGFKSWDDEADYEASVWDLNHKNIAAKVNTETEGTSFVPAVIVPIPLLARVQATACDAMGTQLIDTLDNNVY